MTLITIQETPTNPLHASISFDHRGETIFALPTPLTEKEESTLAWYVEQSINDPSLLSKSDKATAARTLITDFGHRLFQAMFSNPDTYANYQTAVTNRQPLSFAIIGTPSFHNWHWEALKDPQQPAPFALTAPLSRTTMVSPTHANTLPAEEQAALCAFLAELRGGQTLVLFGTHSGTENILRGVDDAYGKLSPEAKALLLCLAPFTDVIRWSWLPQYTQHLQYQPALAALPFTQLEAVVQEARDAGLFTAHERPDYGHIQPIVPYFLRRKLQNEATSLREAITAAYRQHYDGIGGALRQAMESQEPPHRQAGQTVTGLEYENITTALEYALAAHTTIENTYFALSAYLDGRQAHQQGLALGQKVLAQLETIPAHLLVGPLAAELVLVVDNIAQRYRLLQEYPAAQATYQKGLALIASMTAVPAEERGGYQATLYHQLGRVMQEQRQWAAAESAYRQALSIFQAWNDRASQANTYHQLGRVAEEQRQWEAAESAYRQALSLFEEFNNSYGQANTYHQLGIVAQEQRQWAEAKSAYRQALSIYEALNDRYEQAGTYHQLGLLAQERHQWAAAKSAYQQALAIKQEFNDRASQASTYHQLGRVAEAQGQWVAAESAYREALAIKQEFNDRYSQASTYHQLGMVAQEQGQWAAAELAYRQALDIYQAFAERYEQASTYGQLGVLAYMQGHWPAASAAFLQALALFAEFADDDNIGFTVRNLALLWHDSGAQAANDHTIPTAVATTLATPLADILTILRSILAS